MEPNDGRHLQTSGAAIEAHYQLLLWVGPALVNFPKDKKFSLGDRLMAHALDVLGSAATVLRDA